MADSLLEQANKAAIAEVQAAKPNRFTVGGTFDGKELVGGITYERTWKNGWGFTAYAKAYWYDLPVQPKLKAVVGTELSKKF